MNACIYDFIYVLHGNKTYSLSLSLSSFLRPVLYNAVPYITVNIPQNTCIHNRHPIACLWWVHNSSMFYVSVSLYSVSCYMGPCHIGTWLHPISCYVGPWYIGIRLYSISCYTRPCYIGIQLSLPAWMSFVFIIVASTHCFCWLMVISFVNSNIKYIYLNLVPFKLYHHHTICAGEHERKYPQKFHITITITDYWSFVRGIHWWPVDAWWKDQ